MLKQRYLIFFALILVVYSINLTIDVMEPDAAQYAAISREMSETGNYLQIYFRGQDYLDKPPLLFWLSSFSIKLIGNTSLAYKLPSVLMLLVALWATYQFAKMWYDEQTGIAAALILGTTQAFHLMSNDVRTDGLLTSFVILSVWCLSIYIRKGTFVHLFLGGLCIGGGMLAKGPIGLFIPTVAIGGHLVITGQWRKVFAPSWLLLLLPVGLVLAPMCYGLYTQFDLHPEKEVYGLKGPSGLLFFFWTQSFGRITGENQWNNGAPWYFFLQSMLWDLMPWILLFILAFWSKVKGLLKIKRSAAPASEWISIIGFILPFIALSFSGYKLPHYIFPLFPFAAVLVADHLVRWKGPVPNWLNLIQTVLILILVAASFISLTWAFPVKNFWPYLLWICLFGWMGWWFLKASTSFDRLLLPSLSGVLLFQLVLSLHFYPALLQYQSTSQAGKYIMSSHHEPVYWNDKFGYALDYYSGKAIPNAYGHAVDSLAEGSWIYVSDIGMAAMPPHKIVSVFNDYPVTKLSAGFINPIKRKEKIKKTYLIEIIQKGVPGNE